MSAADERAKATKLAPTDFPKALQAAHRVSNPWYRCQSLAAVARFAPEREIVRIAEEARSAAQLGRDVYQHVAASAWPIRALAERGKVREAERMLRQSLDEANNDPHPVSRMAGLILLWQAAWPLPSASKQQALTALLATCQVADSWKAGRIMRDVSLVVAGEDKKQAQQIINAMRDSVYKRQAQRRFDAGQVDTVRFFFPPLQ